MRMIDRTSDRPLYAQLADLLRAKIEAGELAPGAAIPSETTLMQTHDLGRPAVRQAIDVLRREGRVVSGRGHRTRVREQVDRQPVVLGPDDEAIARMPTDQERRRLDLPVGEPVLELRRADGTTEVLAGDSTVIRTR